LKKILEKKEYFVLGLIILLFAVVSFLSFRSIRQLQGNARVVNYVGILRGATQKLVKEELMGVGDEPLMARLDAIVEELLTGEGANNLIVLQDKEYLDNLNAVRQHWQRLKGEILRVREGWDAQILFDSSEEYYELVNATVFSAEAFSERQVNLSTTTLITATAISLLFIIISVIYFLRLMAIVSRQKQLAEATSKALKAERDEISAMKDNLKVGLFLMDRQYIIQPSYSKALENVLGMSDLQGKNFISLLSSSIKAREQETLKDYFTMIFERSFDQKMLEDINPLHEFSYLHIETGEEKTLRCGFAPVEREQAEVFILATLQDITVEIALARQLAEEENKRQEEMRSIFEIIQLEPQVFDDFIEDTEYEFDRINTILKDKTVSSQHAMIEIYQSVHAIKSNAIILGLESYSVKLQQLETAISGLREQQDIPFEAVLHITLELEQIMKERDKFQATINKVASFRRKEVKGQDEYVLVKSLARASEKACEALGKKARFVAEDIDLEAIKNGPRRVMREVLTQLVRNAVFHGIEPPEERSAKGKDETGLIALRIKAEDGFIRIRLSDDGQGINFDQVREAAKKLKFIGADDEPGKKELAQMLLLPGFTTAQHADSYAGRGIGLNLVRERLRDLGGSIKLQTEEGKGTVFSILLPFNAEADAKNRAPDGRQPEPAHAGT
jgi:two-component system chemotaxis sensor kinase CheA